MTAPAWKFTKNPNRSGPETSEQLHAYKSKIKEELKLSYRAVNKTLRDVDDLHRNNAYFGYHRKDQEPVCFEHKYTLDKVRDATQFDPNIPKDTFHPRHTEAYRRSCKLALDTKFMVRTSQSYGRLPPIDMPNYGFGRGCACKTDFYDVSHMGVGRAHSMVNL
eukprot:gnl/TRDRNA2_/TRDRNA2_178477_c0_seq1.p1 gnl/TRDRNA2_/TRDRNA2_178477_c0~~gnl/TRDRNA2_/TRDRNA2_178477_c0_seq1.p1  ORF type:complete len:163 (+),score=20.11 gnl/TRDRNA2_/TRDRNA2_178477_c0_seq1:112-600(+)